MRKTELATAVAKDLGISHRRATKAVNSVFDHIGGALRSKQSVCVTGFGTFKTYTKKRTTVMVDAKTRQFGGRKKVNLPTMKVVGFTTGNSLRKVVRRKARKIYS